ncbi:Heptahelical transmembrane protein 1 [Vitis vinifera]|uniref:Heptahelical transmembrane protein 1 n=1 Tax=Vitis vinifera TaxID=29760 RepID=A0A438J8D6_VITVI|nr:Heptahelical transmembrane protein 1 [Vitis vinifera]
MKDNEFILNYYRANWSLKEALFSVFRWHNETVNVWTHLLGFILFLGLTLANLMQVPQFADFFTNFSWSFPLCAAINASHDSKDFSLVRHIKPHPIEANNTARNRVPVTRNGHNTVAVLHLLGWLHVLSALKQRLPPLLLPLPQLEHLVAANGLSMGMFTIITLLSPSLSSAKYRAFRASLFAAMGLFGILPAIHAVIVNWNEPRKSITLVYELAMALSYGIGTIFYVTRIPERWKPGCFDIAGHSHQIFHVLVVMGALAHYGATLVFLEWRNSVGCFENRKTSVSQDKTIFEWQQQHSAATPANWKLFNSITDTEGRNSSTL